MWDLSGGKEVRSFEAKDLIVYGVRFSQDGKQLASSGDQMVKLWELATGQVIKTFDGNGGSIHSVALSQDGEYLAAGCSSLQDEQGNVRPGEIRVWSLKTGELALKDQGQDPEESTIRSVAFNPTGRILAAGCVDSVVRLYDVP